MLYDKAELYFNIERALLEHGTEHSSRPVCLDSLIKQCGIEIKFAPFKSNAIGALLYKGAKKSGMLINSNKPVYDQRFDMAHEIIHFLLHPCTISFSLSTLVKNKQNEWQANEGAAQLLLPYKDFIPRLVTVASFSQKLNEPTDCIRKKLSDYYNVNYDVVDYRIHNLYNEINQYLDGAALDKIKLTQSEKILPRTEKTHSTLSLADKIQKVMKQVCLEL